MPVNINFDFIYPKILEIMNTFNNEMGSYYVNHNHDLPPEEQKIAFLNSRIAFPDKAASFVTQKIIEYFAGGRTDKWNFPSAELGENEIEIQKSMRGDEIEVRIISNYNLQSWRRRFRRDLLIFVPLNEKDIYFRVDPPFLALSKAVRFSSEESMTREYEVDHDRLLSPTPSPRRRRTPAPPTTAPPAPVPSTFSPGFGPLGPLAPRELPSIPKFIWPRVPGMCYCGKPADVSVESHWRSHGAQMALPITHGEHEVLTKCEACDASHFCTEHIDGVCFYRHGIKKIALCEQCDLEIMKRWPRLHENFTA